MVSLHEEWRAVVGREGQYEVSNQGRVRSLDRIVPATGQTPQRRKGKILSAGTTKKGYRLVVLAGRCEYVHRLVLEAFVGKCPPKHEACHENGVKHDNRLSNLRWDTRPQNNADRVRHGTSNRGERCGSAKLTESQAREILASTEPRGDLAEKFGVRRNTIDRIRSGARWSHLQPKTEAAVLEAVQ